jgi:hypothetical protein
VPFENLFVNIQRRAIEITHVQKGIIVERNHEPYEKTYKEP